MESTNQFQLILVPDENVVAYKLIYMIEVGLRELIIESLSSLDSRWWKTRLPPDLIAKVKNGREVEKKIKWINLTPHHPLYYIDFPDLKKIIDRNDNWRDIFQNCFSDKEVLDGALRGLEPIRNKMAHNRKLSQEEVNMLSNSLSILISSIGENKLNGLISKRTTAINIPNYLENLKQLIIDSYELAKRFKPVNSLELWFEIDSSWWFDQDYLNQDLELIKQFFHLLSQYTSLPRSRGSGYVLEKWIINSNLETAMKEAVAVLNELTSRGD